MKRILSLLFSLPVHFYRIFISPLTRPACRHVPSCSQYALDALRIHGPFKGIVLGTNRILRCRPGGTHGYDPVPQLWIRRYRPWNTWLGRWERCNRLKNKAVRN
jgi:putative membrane protein insertion efficiency factor